MGSNAINFLSAAAIAVTATGLLTSAVNAQQVYRIVGADGKVSFSDQPPPASSNAKTTSSSGSVAISSATPGSVLPFELRQIATKYPVTLYTADNCGPCVSARALLAGRGVPFSEKIIVTSEDAKALQRLSGDASLPFATIGGQQLKGFSDAEWTQFLNAAGYPAASALPGSYRQAAPTPLVAVAAVAPATIASAAARPAAPARTSAPPAASVNNPAGIRF